MIRAALLMLALGASLTPREDLDLLPDSSDGVLQKMRTDKSVLVYGAASMPRVYQDWRQAGSTGGVLPATHDVSGGTDPRGFGNANREFPWAKTAGIDEAEGVTTFKLLVTPSPIVVWRERQNYTLSLPSVDAADAYRWRFPTGTIVAEALMMEGPDGPFVFEVRTRKKVADGDWTPEVYRPSAVTKWEPVGKATTIRIEDDHPKPALSPREADQYFSPRLSREEFRAALSVPFVPVRGEAGGLNWAWNGPYSLVPKGYKGGLHTVTTKSCMECHKDAFSHVDRFDVNREWYGRVSGDDGIISFSPFGRAGANGGDPGLNPALEKAGIISLLQRK